MRRSPLVPAACLLALALISPASDAVAQTAEAVPPARLEAREWYRDAVGQEDPICGSLRLASR